MAGDALDALDEARAWRTVASAVCDAIPAVEVDHSREFAVDTLLVSRVRSELQDDARDRLRARGRRRNRARGYQRLARELERAGFAIVRTR